MGNNIESKSFLQKGEGLRILSIKLNSPFDGKVEPFLDFIIDVVPLEPQRSPKQILEKLTFATETKAKPRVKDFNEIVLENEEKKLQIKIVSTKHRNVRSLTVTPNRNWNGSKDLIGINVRKQKYDQAFDTYFRVAQIENNSPIQHAGVKDGQYLLGCFQFPYLNINNFIEGLYDRFFDNQVPDKHIHLAVYNILDDQVSVKPVLLKRGWGGNGLLGCEFLQGQIYKFPSNLKERRQMLIEQQKIKHEKEKIKFDIEECDGASKTLVEALKNGRNKKGRQMQQLKHMISVPLPKAEVKMKVFKPQPQERGDRSEMQDVSGNKLGQISHQDKRIQFLQNRISYLEETLMNVREYLGSISREEESHESKEVEMRK